MRVMRVIPGLMIVGASLGACDEGADEPAVDFRRSRGECVGTAVLVSGSPTIKSGIPNPIDRKTPLAVTEHYLAQLEANTLFGLSAAFVANDENAALCHDLCAEFESEWSGKGCVIDADIAFGDAEPLEATEDHPAMMMVPIDVSGEMGCACA